MLEFSLREIINTLDDNYTLREDDIEDAIDCLVDLIDDEALLKRVSKILVNKIKDTMDG